MNRKNAIVVALVSVSLASPVLAQDRGPAGTVTLSRTDYDRLLDLSGRPPRPPDVAPMPAALTRADIRARVTGGTVRATMTVDGEIFQAGTVKVPLISNATLLDARSGERPLPLLAEGNAHVAVLSGPAPFSATLEWGARITTSPGRGSFVLPVPPSGSAIATFDVPGELSDLRVSPGLVLRRTSAGGRTIIEATLDPGSATQVWWSAREAGPTVPPRDVRVLADVKTLVTIGEADVRLLSLIDLTVVQGEPAEIAVRLPPGYEVAGVTGASLDRSERKDDTIVLVVGSPARRHQFLLSLERASGGGSFTLETGFPSIPSAQRETGEVAIEGTGTLEVSAADVPGLRRMDVREADQALTSAARQSLLSAYRYQRTAAAGPTLAVNVTRFPDAAVLAAIAERAVATTLVTSEGRALTEISIWLRNRAQPFMKVTLPPGASMLSVEVGGAPAKPAEGADGMRVPLLRPGFRPEGTYVVSFVYLHAGPAFAKKGQMQMTLPRMDVPINVVEWELFVPDRYRADRFDGSAFAAHLADRATPGGRASAMRIDAIPAPGAVPGQIVGQVVDASGAAIPGATVVAEVGGRRQTTVTGSDGRYVISELPAGPLSVIGQLAGFKTARRTLIYDRQPRQVDLQVAIGDVTETVTVEADAPLVSSSVSGVTTTPRPGDTGNMRTADRVTRQGNEQRLPQQAEPSLNVQSLQRRAAGVLPVRIDVPRAGTSHRFIRPLVVDEATLVSFRYRMTNDD
jgi:hypothetical protein